jgi:hypothetical protein
MSLKKTTVNIVLDGTTYPSQKLRRFALWKKIAASKQTQQLISSNGISF